MPSSLWDRISDTSVESGGPARRPPESRGCTPAQLAKAAQALDALASGDTRDAAAAIAAFEDPMCALSIPMSRRRPAVSQWVSSGLWQRARQHPRVCSRGMCDFSAAESRSGALASALVAASQTNGSDTASRLVGFSTGRGVREQSLPASWDGARGSLLGTRPELAAAGWQAAGSGAFIGSGAVPAS